MSNYHSLPQLNEIERRLVEVGYQEPDGATVRNYEFTIGKNQNWPVDLLAFGDTKRLDISTSCIAVQWWPNGGDKFTALQNLRFIGAPIAMFASEREVEIWRVPSPNSPTINEPTEKWEYNRLKEYFSHYKRDLTPKALLEGKKYGRQLSFFEIDASLEVFAQQATKTTLVETFTAALATLPRIIYEHYPAELTRVAIWVLASRILQDKLVNIPEFQTHDVSLLIKALKRHFPAYFKGFENDLNKIGLQNLSNLYSHLHEFSFRSLTNDMLAYFYENTLVDENLRRELGIYYTPRFLTERILKHLPVEDLPLENRVVLDGTSGSGNMLLAAYDRLNSLIPENWSDEQKHNYLLGQIFGIDTDPFACEIARLSLLLYNLPAGDSWKVYQGDVFEIEVNRVFENPPQVIVSNPPFKEPRATEGKRIQKAATILEKYLNWLPPGGLLGIIVPLTFLTNASVRDTRKALLNQCEILEAWHLGEGVVKHWSVSTAIILAQKHGFSAPNKNNYVRVIEVIDRDSQRFINGGLPTFSYIASQSNWNNNVHFLMNSSIIDDIRIKLEQNFSPIQKYAILKNGVQPGKKVRKSHFSYAPSGEINRKVLYNNRRGTILEPYEINWHSQQLRYMKYPGGIQWPREEEDFDNAEKIIINATRNGKGPWRFYAAIDRDRLIPTENFHYILPIKEINAEEITAVLNSTVANAWFASQFHGRDVNIAILKKLPFPQFNEAQKNQIYDLVNSIMQIKSQEKSGETAQRARSITIELDNIVCDGYKLTGKERNRLKKWFDAFNSDRPGFEWKGVKTSTKSREMNQSYIGRKWIMTGVVKDIRLSTEKVIMSIDGQEFEIPIPDNMPGWALRPNAMFDASIPWDQATTENPSEIRWLDFEPVGYDYLTDDELLSRLAPS